jgi:CheY-like chemotaxis protein
MTRILIADDQVPDSTLSSENEVRDHYMALYQDPEFAMGFVFLRRLILLLRERAYELDCANTPDAARDFAKRNTYDAIILDLGWWTLESLFWDP